jgi:hypothetical protein
LFLKKEFAFLPFLFILFVDINLLGECSSLKDDLEAVMGKTMTYSYSADNFMYEDPDYQNKFAELEINSEKISYENSLNSIEKINNSFHPNISPGSQFIQNNTELVDAYSLNYGEANFAQKEEVKEFIIEINDNIIAKVDNTYVTKDNPFPNQYTDDMNFK